MEPPGLFRGRGEHPKMGMLKKRIYPRDITINIGKDVRSPYLLTCPTCLEAAPHQLACRITKEG